MKIMVCVCVTFGYAPTSMPQFSQSVRYSWMEILPSLETSASSKIAVRAEIWHVLSLKQELSLCPDVLMVVLFLYDLVHHNYHNHHHQNNHHHHHHNQNDDDDPHHHHHVFVQMSLWQGYTFVISCIPQFLGNNRNHSEYLSGF